MARPFASGKHAIAECDRCGQQYKLLELRELTVNLALTNLLVCKSCWEEDQPQWQVGRYPVFDPQALRDPRPDTTYAQSRDISWGWNPVGFSDPLNLFDGYNSLVAVAEVGTVTVS